MTRKLNRNFAVAPSVEELEEMYPDIPCDDSGEAEPHDPLCDCDDCTERAEAMRDNLDSLRVSDGEV